MKHLDVAQNAKDRRRMAFELRQSGKTFKEIGETLGIGRSRASQLVAQWERELRFKLTESWHDGLSTRSLTFLKWGEGCKSREDVAALYPQLESHLHMFPNFGKRSLAEVRLWLDHKLPTDEREAYDAITAKVTQMEQARRGLSEREDMERRLKRLDAILDSMDGVKAERERIRRALRSKTEVA